MKKKSMSNLILNAIALAMGVAGAVLSILGQTENLGLFFGIAIFCLAVNGLDKN